MAAAKDIPDIAQQFSAEPVVSISPITDGSINQTYEVKTESGDRFILQGMSEIFKPVVLDNLMKVEPILREAGVPVPACRPTVSGAFSVSTQNRWYRALTYIPGRTIHDSVSVEGARSAGELIGRFHSALVGCNAHIEQPIPHFHDTDHYMERLARIENEHQGTEKYEALAPLVAEVLERYERLGHRKDALPRRIIHGDLKISNVRFDDGMQAIALIDMDTLMESTIAVEMGDALRSWCGTKGEDSSEQIFDQEVYNAAMEGYLEHAIGITEEEITSIPGGIRLLTLELASRFLADAYEEQYFAQSSKYPSLYEQNRTRATNQLHFLEVCERTGL